jgi:thiosulfate dehydrogenase
MNRNRNYKIILGTLVLTFGLHGISAIADEFNDDDIVRWEMEYDAIVDEGERVFHGGLGNENTVSCDQCHPNGANTHPETYPKFQQQLGRGVALWEMINWCIENPLEAEKLAADDPRLIALQTYITEERKGVELAPGKH